MSETNKKKYSNTVRIVTDELAKIASSSNKTEAVKNTGKKAVVAGAAAGVKKASDVLGYTENLNKVKEEAEKWVANKVPYSKYVTGDKNKVGFKFKGNTYDAKFTVNKNGNANIIFDKEFKNDLKLETKTNTKNKSFNISLSKVF